MPGSEDVDIEGQARLYATSSSRFKKTRIIGSRLDATSSSPERFLTIVFIESLFEAKIKSGEPAV